MLGRCLKLCRLVLGSPLPHPDCRFTHIPCQGPSSIIVSLLNGSESLPQGGGGAPFASRPAAPPDTSRGGRPLPRPARRRLGGDPECGWNEQVFFSFPLRVPVYPSLCPIQSESTHGPPHVVASPPAHAVTPPRWRARAPPRGQHSRGASGPAGCASAAAAPCASLLRAPLT